MGVSSSELYGRGIFTTIAIRSAKPLFWDKHWSRLTANAKCVGVDMSGHPENIVAEALSRAVQDEGLVDGRARITFLDKRPGSVWPDTAAETTSMSIVTAGLRGQTTTFKLTASPYRVNQHSPLTGVKSCNYLENVLALEEAQARGFDEAIRINDVGQMTGGCMANIFWIKGGDLFTPLLSTGCLPGTTREHVLEELACREVGMPIDTLLDVDAIFMSSAGLGVVRATELDSRTFNEIDHPILHLVPNRR